MSIPSSQTASGPAHQRLPTYDGLPMATFYLDGGAVIEGLKGYADDLVEKIDSARSDGQTWLWLEQEPPDQLLYGERQSVPVAVQVAKVSAVAGIRTNDTA